MKNTSTFLRSQILIASMIVWLPVLLSSQEQSIKKKDVPKLVIDAFLKSYPKAQIKGFSSESDKEAVLYEVESLEGKVHRDITYLADGTLVSVEETLSFNDLPDPVQGAFHKQYPKGKIILCEKLTKASTIQYELLVSSGGKKYEVVLNPDGTVDKVEQK